MAAEQHRVVINIHGGLSISQLSLLLDPDALHRELLSVADAHQSHSAARSKPATAFKVPYSVQPRHGQENERRTVPPNFNAAPFACSPSSSTGSVKERSTKSERNHDQRPDTPLSRATSTTLRDSRAPSPEIVAMDDEPQVVYTPRKDCLVRDSMAPSPSPPPPRDVYSPRSTFRTKVATKAKPKAKTTARTSASLTQPPTMARIPADATLQRVLNARDLQNLAEQPYPPKIPQTLKAKSSPWYSSETIEWFARYWAWLLYRVKDGRRVDVTPSRASKEMYADAKAAGVEMTHARVFVRFRETHMRLFGAIEKRVLGVRFRDWGKETLTLQTPSLRNDSAIDADIERSPDPDPVSEVEVEVEEPWQAEGEESELDGDDDDAERSIDLFLTDREVTDMAYARNWVWARTGHNAWDSDIADTMMRKHPSRNFSISDWHTAYLSNIRRIDYAAKHTVRERMTVKDESME